MKTYNESDLKECAIQAALFADICSRDSIVIDMDYVNGSSGLYEICADQAFIFCEHYKRSEIDDPDFWDSNDWYTLSDEWFSDQVYPLLNKARI
jgi:hypothetical protein